MFNLLYGIPHKVQYTLIKIQLIIQIAFILPEVSLNQLTVNNKWFPLNSFHSYLKKKKIKAINLEIFV